MNVKVDRWKAKLDFLKSKETTVRWRWRVYEAKHKTGVALSRVDRKAGPRWKEKKRLSGLAVENAIQETMAQTMADVIKLYKPNEEELAWIHKRLMDLVKYQLNRLTEQAKAKKDLDVRELKTLREMLKAEKFEPTRVSKLDADNISSGQATIIISDSIKDLIS